MNWRGEWDCNGSYAVGDAVSYQGSTWIDVGVGIGGCVQPPFEPWHLVAQKGEAGPAGTGLKEMKAALLQWYRQDFAAGHQPSAVAFDGANIWSPISVTTRSRGCGPATAFSLEPMPPVPGQSPWLLTGPTFGSRTK